MDPAELKVLLEAGWSYERIGRTLGAHPETVAGRARLDGLVSAHVARAAPKGPLSADVLRDLLARGFSIRRIAGETGRSSATVRHWLRRHGLEPVGSVRPPKEIVENRSGVLVLVCPLHGETTFARRSDGGARCLACRSAAVVKRRRKIKRILVEEAGGACAVCGYDRCTAALQFHHLDRTSKRFELSRG